MTTSQVNIILCSSLRSGGNWLAKELHSRGYPLCKEYLSRHSAEYYDDYIRCVANKQDYGIKIHPTELLQSGMAVHQFVSPLVPTALIWLERKSITDQINSYAGAAQTGNFFNGSTQGIARPTGHQRDIIRFERLYWKVYFMQRHDYHKVYYEDIGKSMDGIVEYIEGVRRST